MMGNFLLVFRVVCVQFEMSFFFIVSPAKHRSTYGSLCDFGLTSICPCVSLYVQ